MTDHSFIGLADSDCLVWMPAHKTIRAVGEVKLSDGSRMTLIDWRANRLADAIARRCAHLSAVPSPVAAMLRLAADVLRTEAGTLGAVTKAANRHRVPITTDGGHHTSVIRRDSVRPVRPSFVAARAVAEAGAPSTSWACSLAAHGCLRASRCGV